MNSAALFQFLRDWIVSVVGTGIEVIQSHDNGPSPSDTYMILEAVGGWDTVGRPSHTVSDPTYIKPQVNDYQVTIQLWEMEGDGDLTRACLESVYSQDNLDLFSEAGVSILSTQGPSFTPIMEGSKWTKQVLTVLTLSVARGDTGNSDYIAEIEFIPNLGGT